MKLNIKGKTIEVNEDKLIELIKREGLEVKSGELKKGEKFWYHRPYGDIDCGTYDPTTCHKEMKDLGNAYTSKEEVEQALERRKSIVKLWNWQKENAPFEPDWSNPNESKNYSIYLYDLKQFSSGKTWNLKPQTELPYFATSDDVERFNKACEKDLLTVFNVK